MPGQICWRSNCLIWLMSLALVVHSRVGRASPTKFEPNASREGLWLASVFASAHFLHSNRVPNPAVEGPFAAAIA